jgi:deoxyadenosine/deoxycytidine kinase
MNAPFEAATKNMSCEDVRKKKLKISIEGIIGCGKSCLMDYLAKEKDVQLIQEPVEEWKNWHGKNILKEFYNKPKEYCFLFQNAALQSATRAVLEKTNATVRITERSPHSAHLFATKLRKERVLSSLEYIALTKWYHLLCEKLDLKLDLIVYIKTLPEMACARTKRRNRYEERNLTMKDHQKLSILHDWWLMGENFDKTELEKMEWTNQEDDALSFEEVGEKSKLTLASNNILKDHMKYKGAVLVLDGNKEGDDMVKEYEKLVEWIDDWKRSLEMIKSYRNNLEYAFK